jgi:SAM-dependent methyltransferase
MSTKALRYKKRPILVEREDYTPAGPQEEFIVPLLKDYILKLIDLYFQNGNKKNVINVLDIGCGKQPFKEVFLEHNCNYYSLDTQEQLDRKIDFICSFEQPFPAEVKSRKYDFVLCTEVLEHVANWNIAFSNLQDIVTNQGCVLITCPHFYQLHEEPYDFWRPTTYALEKFALNYGFKVEKSYRAGTGWDVIGTLLANCYFFPKQKKFKDKVLFFIFYRVLNWLTLALKERRLQERISINTPLYLSNIIFLKRI